MHIPGQDPLSASMLAAALPQEQKQMLGERLFPIIHRTHTELAGKITGMSLAHLSIQYYFVISYQGNITEMMYNLS